MAAQEAEQARLRREAAARETEAKAAVLARAEAAERARQAEVKRQQEEAEAARRAAEAAKQQPVWQRIGIELVKIPTGEFLYGENKQKITLPEYHIAKTPVTNAQYKAFVDAMGYRPPSHWQDGQIPKGKENHPVVYVDWNGAGKFCQWAGLRLPSEQEWEKAARGTEGREYPWGAAAPTEKLCNFNMDYKDTTPNVKDTTPVGHYSPAGDSPYGCADMAGNVWEWCADCYDSSRRAGVLRGGSFYNEAQTVHCAERCYPPEDWFDFTGFRVASPDL